MNLTPGSLTLETLQSIHAGVTALAFDAGAMTQVRASAAVVQRAAQSSAPTYGVNTGFGKLASTRISEADLATLQ
ncbi:MAG TPA: aromatic amino acid lyase, partial [Burkholderiaceae bacterium]|nr:aromatic amino acid lyase [Burkholderiaceae bacterium]